MSLTVIIQKNKPLAALFDLPPQPDRTKAGKDKRAANGLFAMYRVSLFDLPALNHPPVGLGQKAGTSGAAT